MTSKIMKTMKTMLAFVAGALALSACNNEDAILNENQNENENGAKLVTLTAYQEGEGTTRAAIDGTDNTKINWTASDAIKVFGTSTSAEYTTSTGGSTSANFTGSTVAGADVALYPYQAAATNDEGVITAEVPMTQYAVAGSFDPKAALMVGVVNGTSVSFKNVMSYVKVTIPSTMTNCKQVVLKAKDAWTTVAGKVTINASAASWTDVLKEGQAFVRLVPQEGSTTLTAGASYYIAILPQTMSTGFELIFNDNDVIKVKQSASSSVEFGRSKTKKLADITSFTYTVSTVAVGEGATAITMADRNIGAAETSAYGDYFAWGALRPAYKTKAVSVSGSTTTLTDLYWDGGFIVANTPYYDGTSAYTKYTSTDGKTVLDANDDIASMLWGGNWRMATQTEWDNNSSVTQVKDLPFTGYSYNANLNSAGRRGCYWSSTVTSRGAYCIKPDGSGTNGANGSRYYGYSVRPVLAQ